VLPEASINWCASAFAGWGRMRFNQTYKMRVGSQGRTVGREFTNGKRPGVRIARKEKHERRQGGNLNNNSQAASALASTLLGRLFALAI
jgi:hypothetical protein